MVDERKKQRNQHLRRGVISEAASAVCFTLGAIPRITPDGPKETTNPIYFTLGAVLCVSGLILFWLARKNHLAAMNALNAPAAAPINQAQTDQPTPPSSVNVVELAEPGRASHAQFFPDAKQAESVKVKLEINEDKRVDQNKEKEKEEEEVLSSSISYIRTGSPNPGGY